MHPRITEILQASKDARIHAHADYGVIKSPKDFANALGYPIERITKTLFMRTEGGASNFGLVVCPIPRKVNIPAVSAAFGCRRAEMASPEELKSTLDYPQHGVSPLGAGEIPVLVDESIFGFPSVLIGAGIAGQEIEIAPDDILRLSRGTRGAYTQG
jgi:Cys-tRNA(Pro)/Cys-tRNA(Cys) deacylase